MPSPRPGKGTAGEPMSRARAHLRPDRGPRAWAKIPAVYRLSGMSEPANNHASKLGRNQQTKLAHQSLA